MAEHFRFQKGLRHGCAVDGDEAPVLALAVRVNGLRDEFLAGAALALDRTVASVGATRSIISQTLRMAGLSATMFSNW